MGMKISFNHLAIQAKIEQTGDRAVKGMSDVLRRRARLIRDLARSYAPRMTGLLERSIDYVTIKGSNRRNTFVVYVDMDADAPHGKTVGDYAPVMERKLRPYGAGRFNLGKGSKEKRAAGNDVGGRFFRRAVEKGTDMLDQEIRAAARGKKLDVSSAKTNYRPATQMARSRNRKRSKK